MLTTARVKDDILKSMRSLTESGGEIPSWMMTLARADVSEWSLSDLREFLLKFWFPLEVGPLTEKRLYQVKDNVWRRYRFLAKSRLEIPDWVDGLATKDPVEWDPSHLAEYLMHCWTKGLTDSSVIEVGLDVPIRDLNTTDALSGNARNRLLDHYTTMREVYEAGPEEISTLHNIGTHSLRQIFRYFESLGLTWGADTPVRWFVLEMN